MDGCVRMDITGRTFYALCFSRKYLLDCIKKCCKRYKRNSVEQKP